MNKTVIGAMLGISALSCGSRALAQNSVTLYGVIDTGITYVHNAQGQSTLIALVSGGESGGRWGLKGSEDIGGGLRTVFQLENGFNSTNGHFSAGSNRMFGRQAFVGLSSTQWGTVTAGRQYDPLTDLITPLQNNLTLTTPGDVDNSIHTIRFNNTVKWASPQWSGLSLSTMYGFGNVSGSLGSGQTYSGAAAYTYGPVGLAAGYLHIDNGNATVSSRTTTSADSIFQSSISSAYSSARSVNIARAGANYTIGSVILGGYYSFSQYNPDSFSTFSRAEKYSNALVYTTWNITPSFQAEVGYDFLKSSGDSAAKENQFSMAVDYFVSKRTDFYVVGSYAHATGTNGMGAAQAVSGDQDLDAGKSSQATILLAMRHHF